MEPYLADLINNNKIPKSIRYLLVSIPHLFLISMFILLSINSKNIAGSILFILLTVLFIVTYVFLILKVKKSNK